MVCLLTTRLFWQLLWAVDHPTPPFFRREMDCTCEIYTKVCMKKRGVCTGDLQRCRGSDRVTQGDTTWHKALFSLRLVS